MSISSIIRIAELEPLYQSQSHLLETNFTSIDYEIRDTAMSPDGRYVFLGRGVLNGPGELLLIDTHSKVER
jgi:hypothetical protein